MSGGAGFAGVGSGHERRGVEVRALWRPARSRTGVLPRMRPAPERSPEARPAADRDARAPTPHRRARSRRRQSRRLRSLELRRAYGSCPFWRRQSRRPPLTGASGADLRLMPPCPRLRRRASAGRPRADEERRAARADRALAPTEPGAAQVRSISDTRASMATSSAQRSTTRASLKWSRRTSRA